MTVRDGDEIVKVIKMIDQLLLEYKKEEMVYPHTIDKSRRAFCDGRKTALTELKKRYIMEMRCD